jgi:hypothetical protein
MMNGPKAAVILSAPNLCAGGAFLALSEDISDGRKNVERIG